MRTQLSGSDIRKQLRDKGLPGGSEVICCGGRKQFSRDYHSQLKRLKYKPGEYSITENGIIVAFISL